jgi:hypothetical protein
MASIIAFSLALQPKAFHAPTNTDANRKPQPRPQLLAGKIRQKAIPECPDKARQRRNLGALEGARHEIAARRSSYNEEMARVILYILVAAALAGQTPPAPPEVDTALRARIGQFYQFEVDGKYNQALQLVAEDTKDLFVGSSKPTYQSFEIKSIQYSDDFTKAEVMLLVNRLLPLQGFMGRPIPTKMTSRWKIENGQWCYYVDPQKDMPSTPFGGLPIPGMAQPTPGAANTPRALPPMPANLPDPRALTTDKTSVELKSASPSEQQVTISNPSPWAATLGFSDPKVPGLTVKLDPLTVYPHQKAILSIRSSGGVQIPKALITITVTNRQTNQAIPIKVSFTN